MNRRLRDAVVLGIADETVHAGDHIAYFYDSEAELERAFGFVDAGLEAGDHCVIFGTAEDLERMLRAVRKRRHDPDELIASGRLSVLSPRDTCDETLNVVSAHFEKLFEAGVTFIRFIGNAAVGRDGWPAEDEFYKLEAAVSEATQDMPCVAICMFDLRTQPARTIMKAAFEGHPITLHANCVRENPYFVPRAAMTG